MKTIKISLIGTPHDYPQGLLPLVIQHLGYHIDWVRPASSDLVVYGAFFRGNKKRFRWLPRPVRPLAARVESASKTIFGSRSLPPLTLFHTGENIRLDAVDADYAMSFDLAVSAANHLRFPYWMEMVDWSHEGLTGNTNARFGKLLSIPRLMQPLGDSYLKRPRRAAIFSSHLREPRRTLVEVVGKVIPVQGFGPHFDKSISDHHKSGFNKVDILQDFAFNLCPENGLYPGYYTEKIPEAFSAGCLPLTWADINVSADFNPDAFINLEPMTCQEFSPLQTILDTPSMLGAYAEQPLLLKAPSIQPLKNFLAEILRQATS